MKNRRSEYDVTNQVDLSDAASVSNTVLDIFRDVYPKFNESALKQAFADCQRLFAGEYPGYLPCDTLYHDQQHTLDMTLALTRLINGHERTVDKADRIGPERAVIAVITALYHDSGYIRRNQDHHHHNGAEYTTTHVSRSADFLRQYLIKIGLGEHVNTAANMVHYTGYEVSPENIYLPDDRLHLAGHMLGTADLIAQMSDRCYLEKCRDRLYPEFVLGGLTMRVDKNGKQQVLYESGEDLLRKTPGFYKHEVENRLNKLFNRVYEFERAHFDGEHQYIHALGQNQSYLKKVLEKENFELLRRSPPKNFGVLAFPGLDVYLNQHPVKSKAR